MTETSAIPSTVMLASFYKRLTVIEPAIRVVISEAELSALLTFRGEPETKALLDYSCYPARVVVDDETRTANVIMTINGDVMHEIMSDRMKPVTALARREMLLRGSASDLAKFIQLLEFGPLLYDEYLADLGLDGYARYKGAPQLNKEDIMGETYKGDAIPIVKYSFFEKLFIGVIDKICYAAGYVLGVLRYRVLKKLSIFNVLSALGKGLEAARPPRPKE